MAQELSGKTKVIVERIISGRNTFGGYCPPHTSVGANEIQELLAKEQQRHEKRIDEISNMLRAAARKDQP